MEVRVQLPFDNGRQEFSKWQPRDPCRLPTSSSNDVLKLSVAVSSEVHRVTPNQSDIDRFNPKQSEYLIRDKAKLLQLADKVMTKKSSTPVLPPRNTTVTTPARRSSSVVAPRRQIQIDQEWIDGAKVRDPEPEPLFQKVGSSFRRSKLYASFSPSKRSFQRLVKTDPAKTDIQHLVNHKASFTPRASGPRSQEGKYFEESCYHANVNLSSLDGPRSHNVNSPLEKPSFHDNCLSSLEVPGFKDNVNSSSLERPGFNDNSSSLHGTSFPGSIKSSSLDGPSFHDNVKLSSLFSPKMSHDPKSTNTVTMETKDGSDVSRGNLKGDRPLTFGDLTSSDSASQRKANSGFQCSTFSDQEDTDYGFGFRRNGVEIPTTVAIMAQHAKENIMRNEGNETNPRNHDSLTTSILHNSYLIHERKSKGEVVDRKQSCSIPTAVDTTMTNQNLLQNQQQRDSFWSEVGGEKLKGIEEKRTGRSGNAGKVQEFNSLQQEESSPVKMRSEKREGRPMSLDCGQRKAWLKAIGDMNTEPVSPLPPQVKRSSKPKAKRPLSITHLHLADQGQGQGHEEDEETSSVGSNGDANSSKGTTPSIFQRFSKTFSLRFGSSNPKTVKNRFPTGSSPDLPLSTESVPKQAESVRKKIKHKVDPSSGKVRKRAITSLRDDKCQSGDSGIQLEEDDRIVIPNPKPVSDFETSRRQSSVTISPISMKKLSLVEIPGDTWDGDADAGFVSANEDEDERVIQNGSALPPSSFHSLPLKYSRQRKTDLVVEKKAVVRASVVKEFLTTEANYVKSLNDIMQGFVIPCRGRSDLFSDKTIANIFSNVEDILRLHARILEALQSSVACAEPNLSEAKIGHIFIEWAGAFDLYSEYCYQNPMSMATVRQLCLNREYAEFFEACRRLQLMDKLPLHGFLLRPIQRICQYHLQLNELLKNTPATHEDYDDVETALKTMKGVAMKMNDTQRKFDSLQEIVRLQSSIDGWEGEDLVPGSAAILLKGDLIKTTVGHRPKEVYAILLNNEILLCRKDYYRKGSIFLCNRAWICAKHWVDIIEDDEFFGSVQNSWRIYNAAETEWILLTAPSPAEKQKWINAFALTRKPFPVDAKMSEMAKFTALKQMLTESQSQTPCHGGPFNGSTLPRLRKSRKNMSSLTKSDSDAMLIEVGKLRKSNNNIQLHNQNFQRGGSTESAQNQLPNSRFYI